MQDNEPNNVQNAIPVTIAPWLSVTNAPKAVKFYKEAFGAIEAYRLEAPDGGLVVKLSVNGAAFWVSGEEPDDNTEPPILGGNSVRMILTVGDPDTFFAQALQAGAKEIFPVTEAHGWRLGRLVDPFGLHWEIGREV
jgi:PhnB protein